MYIIYICEVVNMGILMGIDIDTLGYIYIYICKMGMLMGRETRILISDMGLALKHMVDRSI